LYSGRDVKPYICKPCGSRGERNAFFGKTHSDATKSRISEINTGARVGELNPFYGKHHSEKTKSVLRVKCVHHGESNGFYGKQHTDATIAIIRKKNIEHRQRMTPEDVAVISEKQTAGHRRAMQLDPVRYREARIKANRISLANQERYKINRIEQAVQRMLCDAGLEFEYSVILGFKQFDFGNKQRRILIEVHGDYWHGNPEIYGDGKRPLNDIQRNRMDADESKRIWAEEHGFRLIVVWERQLKANNTSWLKEVTNAYEILAD